MEALKKNVGRSIRVGIRRPRSSSPSRPTVPARSARAPSASLPLKRRFVSPASASQKVLIPLRVGDAGASTTTLGCVPFYTPRRLPSNCLPIRADIRTFDVDKLMAAVGNFQSIICNFPWTAHDVKKAPYKNEASEPLTDDDFRGLPMATLQQHGYLFLWVSVTKVALAVETLEEEWDYTLVGNLTLVKMSVLYTSKAKNKKNRPAKETCLVARKGSRADAVRCYGDVLTTTAVPARTENLEQLYCMAEAAAGAGHCLELFASGHSLRDGWVSIGEGVPCEK